jgi:hypothetical protein
MQLVYIGVAMTAFALLIYSTALMPVYNASPFSYTTDVVTTVRM